MNAHLPALEQICSQLSLQPTADQLAAMGAFLNLLQRWNATYNLTSVRDPAAMLTQHLADCLAVLPALHRQPIAQGRVLDVGSGGGLPGVLLAIMAPELAVTCVDTVGKKAAFIQQVAGTLKLSNLRAVHGRVEQLKLLPFDIITSRAFASLDDFTRLTSAHMADTGVWMAMKGKSPADEINALPTGIEVFHVEPLRVPGLEAERCLVWMRKRPADS